MSSQPSPAPANPDPDRRRRAIGLGLGAMALAAIVVVVLVLTSQSGGEDTGSDSAESGEATIDDLPQEGSVIGDPDAPVKLVEYGDLQCPACAAFSRDVVPELISGPVADGEASLEFRSYLIIGPESLPAAEAALAAGEQGRLWQFVETFYAEQGAENSGYVTDDFLRGIAEDAGVPDLEKWEQERSDPAREQTLRDQQTEAGELGLSGTPSLVLEAAGDSPEVLQDLSLEAIESAIAGG